MFDVSKEMRQRKSSCRVFSALAYRRLAAALRNLDADDRKRLFAQLESEEKLLCIGKGPGNGTRFVSNTARKICRIRKSVAILPSSPHIRILDSCKIGKAMEMVRQEWPKGCSGICYVVDRDGRFKGTVTAAQLISSRDSMEAGELVAGTDFFISSGMSICAASSEMEHLFLDEAPVLDGGGRLLSVLKREQLMAESERQYFNGNILVLAKNRMVWLLLLMLSAMITGRILGRYENSFATLPVLVTFIPMLTDTGGNAGSQSSTVVIRAMALGQVEAKDFGKVLAKEFLIAVIVGSALAMLNFIRLELTGGPLMIALTVSLSLYATIVLSKCIGGTLPIIARKFNMDPAMMAAPLVTTIVDALSLMIYFSIASHLLAI